MSDERDKSLRETLEDAYDAETRGRKGASMSKPPPEPNAEAPSNKAVIAQCELLGLLFALPFGEDLYRGTPVTGWHIFYLIVGLFFAGLGGMWPSVRRRFPGNLLLLTLGRAGSDGRWWLAILLVLLVYTEGPNIYRRAVAPELPIPTTAVSQQEPVAQDTGCMGPCPKYVGTPIGWAWDFYATVEASPRQGQEPIISAFRIYGKNVSAEPAELKNAYIESRFDGTRLPLMVSADQDELIAISDATPVPPLAQFFLSARIVDNHNNASVTESEFMRKWGSSVVVIEYDNYKITHPFTRDALRLMIDSQGPNSRPRVTRRKP
jgi:hypothetical protein